MHQKWRSKINKQISCGHKDRNAHKDGSYNNAAIRKRYMKLHTNGEIPKPKESESIRVNRNSTKF